MRIYDPALPPNNIQIELVEGCNRMCNFCGIYGIWKNPKDRKVKFMNRKLVSSIATELGEWFPKGRRIEFAMHGEPLLYPNLIWVIEKFRKFNPKAQLQITTNGLLLTKELVEGLFNAGLNILIVDLYVKKNKLLKMLRSAPIEFEDYYHTDFNPYYYHRKLPKKIVCMFDLGVADGKKKTRVISNHAGNAKHTIPITPFKKKCDKPFRELTIHYDGTVPGCCMDWRHELIIGDATKNSLIYIWQSVEMNVLRYKLFNKDRSMVPCCTCDYGGGFRLGFLKPPVTPTTNNLRTFKKKRIENKKYHHKNARKSLTFEELQQIKRRKF